jgi:hypothetical protein
MVLLVLTVLAIVGTPFVISMALHDKASTSFSGRVLARLAADGARNHALVRLEETVYGKEWLAEERELEGERPERFQRAGSAGPGARRTVRRSFSDRRGTVVRRDLGESPRARRDRARSPGDGAGGGDGEGLNGEPREDPIPEALRVSAKGPSPRDFDLPEELVTELPPEVTTPAPPRVPTSIPGVTAAAGEVHRFRDPQGVAASAEVVDEQGKINVNTAPPNLIANLFGVSQLARPLAPQETSIVLDDALMFYGDKDEGSMDGAVVLVHPGTDRAEAVTYNARDGDTLKGCFRGAFFSLIPREPYPAGTFVHDLRGWKLGYHRLWAGRQGGFHPRALGTYPSLEAMREIASWQVASLFLARFRGEGLTAEFLRQNGVKPSKLEELGLDPFLFAGEESRSTSSKEYREAEKRLRKIGLPSALVRKLEARGLAALEDLAARLAGAGREEVERLEKDLAASLERDRRREPKLPRGYLNAALDHLAEAYRTPGLETLLPQDLEYLREWVTVSSGLPQEWSEAQSLLDDVAAAAAVQVCRVPRGSEFNPGTVVRLRALAAETGGAEGAPAAGADHWELNEVGVSGEGIPYGGFVARFPLLSSYRGYGAVLQALQRHPVNVNTAPHDVLRAVFTGVRGYNKSQVVTPREADQLASRVRAAVPLKGHRDFYDLLEGAKGSIIDEEDVEPLLVNAVAPTHNLLLVSTTGFAYASGDVYTIESRGVARAPSGREVAQSRFREVVEVSPARRLALGWLTQGDLADGVYVRDPLLSPGFPESHHDFLLPFAGARAHLVQTRPLMLHRARHAFPGGDVGNLRLFPSETPPTRQRFALDEVFHFRDTFDGLELAHGEPWPISLALQGGAGGAGGGGAGSGGRRDDLTTVPGGIEFWFRMRTYPGSVSEDGHLVLFDAGVELDRNRVSLLYDQARGRVLLRIRDASFHDPSVVRNRDNGQYLEVSVSRTLELQTWYHLRALWDGVFGGGAELYIDGVHGGTDNLSTELVGAIPAASELAVINVRDGSRFPREGAVRIDGEVFEYTGGGSNSLQVRREPPSHFRPLPRSRARSRQGGRIEEPPGEGEGAPGGRPPRGPGAGGAGPPRGALAAQAAPPPAAPGPAAPPRAMRSPWNRRGYSASAHRPGAKVSVHGYSLEIRRKLFFPGQQVSEQQAPRGSNEVVWGRGGRRLAGPDPLLADNFPAEVLGIIHFAVASIAFPELGEYILPLFEMDTEGGADGEPGRPPGGPGGRPGGPGGGPGGPGGPGGGVAANAAYRALLPGGERNAAEYFQTKGVCVVGGEGFFYRKEPLPPQYLAIQELVRRLRPDLLGETQETGLKVLCRFESGRGPSANCLEEWNREHEELTDTARRLGPGWIIYRPTPLSQRSVLADGPIAGYYPRTGLLEIRGSPTPWEKALGRPDCAGQPAFGKHPDDVVEWLRYREIYDGGAGGETFHVFIGRLGQSSNFRGYPDRPNDHPDYDLRKQLDHFPGEPLRLVMELSQGGAGYGDYVTIATSRPEKHEATARRVYKVMEHTDGRFFVSLLDVGATGTDIALSPGTYQNDYTMADEPRLVKFPTWKLPELGSGRGLFFDSFEGRSSGGAGRRNPTDYRERGEEDTTGITLDEVRRLRNIEVSPPASGETPARYVVVPLQGGRVQLTQGPEGASISGAISAEQDLTRSSPLEVFVVSLQEGNANLIFAPGEDEGLLRIGDELFYFEDPAGGSGEGARVSGSASYQGASGPAQGRSGVDDETAAAGGTSGQSLREKDPGARGEIWRIAATVSGRFEPEGFARLESNHPETSNFYEIFYYGQLAGGFSSCLRGQFGTSFTADKVLPGAPIRNVSRRLRLIGRSLLGSPRQAHGIGDPCALVPYLGVSPILGPITNTGLSVKRADDFSPSGGYLMLDPARPGVPWEIIAHLGPRGEGLLERPRNERGDGVLRARFGTPMLGVAPNAMFAYDMPYRYPDRYEAEVESESLAYLQRSYRVPGAYWRSIEWLERPPEATRERRTDLVFLVRFNGAPEWDAEPTNSPGGLYFFEDQSRERREVPRFDLNHLADQIEVRVYFRYLSGAYARLGEDQYTDDWKETPILEWLKIRYEKPRSVLRHEELPF